MALDLRQPGDWFGLRPSHNLALDRLVALLLRLAYGQATVWAETAIGVVIAFCFQQSRNLVPKRGLAIST